MKGGVGRQGIRRKRSSGSCALQSHGLFESMKRLFSLSGLDPSAPRRVTTKIGRLANVPVLRLRLSMAVKFVFCLPLMPLARPGRVTHKHICQCR